MKLVTIEKHHSFSKLVTVRRNIASMIYIIAKTSKDSTLVHEIAAIFRLLHGLKDGCTAYFPLCPINDLLTQLDMFRFSAFA